MSVTLVYLLFVLIFLGLLTWGGFVLVDQLQSLYDFLQRTIVDLPKLLADLAANGLIRFHSYRPLKLGFVDSQPGNSGCDRTLHG